MLTIVFNEVHTKRLVLRRPTSNDSAAMFMIDGDPATHQFNPAGPDTDRASSERRLQDWLLHWQDNGYGYWAVTISGSTDVIGFGGVMRIHWQDRDVLNLYYRFTPKAWGHGYATELAQTAVDLAQTYLPQFPIVARIRDKNVASKRVAEHAGLQRRPELDTEHVVFALGWMDDKNSN